MALNTFRDNGRLRLWCYHLKLGSLWLRFGFKIKKHFTPILRLQFTTGGEQK